MALIIHVFEVVVENGDVAYAFLDGIRGQVDERLGTRLWIGLFPPAAFAAKGITKQVLDIALFVARQRDASGDARQQSQIAEARGGGERRICGGSLVEPEVGSMTCLCF